MDTQEFIRKHQEQRHFRFKFQPVPKRYLVAGEPLVECKDAILLNGRYEGNRVSDIFIFDPGFVLYLVRCQWADEELKSIAREVIRNQSKGMEDIARRIALG